MDRIEGHECQIPVRHPFKEGYALVLQVHLLRVIQIIGLVNGNTVLRHICHIFEIMGIVGLTFDADLGIQLLSLFFCRFRYLVLYIGHIIVSAGQGGKENAVHIEIRSGLDADAQNKAECQLA